MGMTSALAAQLGQMLLVLALAPALTGVTRKMKARLQRRIGPPIFQPYRDLRRLFGKDVVLADNSSWLFRVAPYLIFAATWVAAALVPTFQTGLLFSWAGDLIAIVALLGAARFVQAVAALDTGTSFGGIGASREVMIAVSRRAGDDHGRVHGRARRRVDAIVHHRGLHGGHGRPARFARHGARRAHHRRAGGKCPHPGRQSVHASRSDDGA